MLSSLKSAIAAKQQEKKPATGKKWKTNAERAKEEADVRDGEQSKKRRTEVRLCVFAALCARSCPAQDGDASAFKPYSAAVATGGAAELANMLPREELVRLLRARGQPVTLFGENNAQRAARWRKVEAMTSDAVGAGQQNVYAQLLEEVHEEAHDGSVRVADADEAKLAKLVPAAVVTKEDEMLHYFFGLLREWGVELAERPEAERKSAAGKKDKAVWKQTLVYILPLFRKLASRGVEAAVQDPIYKIMGFMRDRKYVDANDAYLLLAIGNAPWPMGVTMVGIHERSAREKIGSDNCAHVLNDETQRKYVQSIKRLISYAQKKYPSTEQIWQ